MDSDDSGEPIDPDRYDQVVSAGFCIWDRWDRLWREEAVRNAIAGRQAFGHCPGPSPGPSPSRVSASGKCQAQAQAQAQAKAQAQSQAQAQATAATAATAASVQRRDSGEATAATAPLDPGEASDASSELCIVTSGRYGKDGRRIRLRVSDCGANSSAGAAPGHCKQKANAKGQCKGRSTADGNQEVNAGHWRKRRKKTKW